MHKFTLQKKDSVFLMGFDSFILNFVLLQTNIKVYFVNTAIFRNELILEDFPHIPVSFVR